MNALEMINKCIKEMEEMTQEEFDSIVCKKNIDAIIYDEKKYVGGGFTIKLPEVTSEKENQEIDLVGKYIDKNSMLYNDKIEFSNEYVCDSWSNECVWNSFESVSYTYSYSKIMKSESFRCFDKILQDQKFSTQNMDIENLNLKDNKFNKIEDDFSKAA